jgi:hypothetical protein
LGKQKLIFLKYLNMKIYCKSGLTITCFFLAVTTLLLYGCKKVGIGFLSDGVYYQDTPFKLDKGATTQTTSALTLDGTTLPAEIKLLDVRNAVTHLHADEFFQESEVFVYKEAIDPKTDTTIELVNKKRELKKIPPFQFLPSGQFLFNAGTAGLPTGAVYEYDISVSNSSGAKTYKNIGLITVVEKDPFEITTAASSWFRDFSTTSGSLPTPVLKITKISETGTNAILKITDEDGVVFNPKKGEVITRGDRSSFMSFAKFHPVEITDTALICNYEIVPFPIAPAAQGYLMYYRIPSEFSTISATIPAAEAPFTHSINPRFEFHLTRLGSYLIEVKIPGVKHK